MNDFWVFFQLGLSHITDVQGYDHILFVVSLCAIFSYKDLKKVAWLVTAFTIGHSFTLLLSALKVIMINPQLIELCIAITILVTCCFNLYKAKKLDALILKYHYVLAAFFGLIHGLGFSNFFNTLMGENTSVLYPLACFNLGLEFGQLIIVAVLFALNYLLSNALNVKSVYWNYAISFSCGVVSVFLIFERI